MTLYEFFKDFAGPVSTASAAIAAATVAGIFASRQAKTAELQAKIALEKLKYETMGDRLAIIESVGNLIQVAVGSSSNHLADGAKMQQHIREIQLSRFYFRPEVVIYLDDIIEQSHKAAIFINPPDAATLAAMDAGNRQAYADERSERSEARKFLYKERNSVAAKIEKEVSLEFLKSTGGVAGKNHVKVAGVLNYLLFGMLVLIVGLALGAIIAGS